jgi:hypothetical protein
MELIASQVTGIFMFHLRVLVFRLFQKPENRQFRFFEQKSESEKHRSRLFQKPEKDWQFSGKNQPFMASGFMAGYLKKVFQTKFENHGYIQRLSSSIFENHTSDSKEPL